MTGANQRIGKGVAPAVVAVFLLTVLGTSGCGSGTSPSTTTETPSSSAAAALRNDPQHVIESVARGITHNLRNEPDLQTATASRMTAAEAADEISRLGGHPSSGFLSASSPTEQVWLVRFDGSFVGIGQNVLYEPAKGTFVTVISISSGGELYSETIYDEPTPTVAGCGPWFSQDSSLGTSMSDQYGELRNCGFFDGYWVITTLGKKLADGSQASGTIALYFCKPGDATCDDGNSDHPLSGWSFISPPYKDGVTLLRHAATNLLVVSNGGHQLLFDLSTRQFSDDKPVTTE